jgi:hypothetical protein
MADVFISYKSDDRPQVQPLVMGLRAHGLSVWWDQDIAPDAPWELTIERELRGARAAVVAWSANAVASENVKAEARWARREGRLVQVFIAHCDPPLFFGERQGVSLHGWSGDTADHRFQAIVAAVGAIIEGRAPPAGVGYAPLLGGRRWRPFLAVGAAAAALVTVAVVAASVLVRTPPQASAPVAVALPAATLARQALIQSVRGPWDRQGGNCAAPMNIDTSAGAAGATTITVSGPGSFKSVGQVITADDGKIVVQDIDAAGAGAGEIWKYDPNGALMTVSGKGVQTPLKRCPLPP